MLGNRSRLPFSAERLNDRNAIIDPRDARDLPRLRVQISREMEEYMPELTWATIKEIQDKTAKNTELRIFAFNLFSDRGYENENFLDLVQTFAVFVENEAIKANADPLKVVEGTVDMVVEAATATLVTAFPELESYIPDDRESTEIIEQAMRTWAVLDRAKTQYLRSSARGRDRDDRGGSSLGRGLGGRDDREDRGGGFGSRGLQGGRGIQRSNREYRPSWEMNRNDGGDQTQQGGSTLNRGLHRAAPAADAGRVVARGDTPSSVGIRGTGRPMNELEPRPLVKPVGETAPTGPRPFDKIVNKNGVAIPAMKSDVAVAGKPERPPLVFNRDTHMLFHVMPTGGSPTDVFEEIVKIEPEMEYLQHELNDKLKQSFKGNQALHDPVKVVPEILQARQLVPNRAGTVATKVDEATRKELDEAGAPRQLMTPLRAGSLAEASFMAQMEVAREGGDIDYLEYQVEELKESVPGIGAQQAVLALRESKSLDELHKSLIELHRTEVIDDALLRQLDERITAAVNRFCAKQLYLGSTIDSFVDDYEGGSGIKAYIRNKHGEAIYNRFLGGYKTIIARATSVLTGEALTKYLANLPEDQRRDEELPAVFTNRYSVTELPWTSVDLLSQWRLEGVVKRDQAPELADALAAIFARTKSNDVHEHLLYTTDKKIVYAYRGVLMDDTYSVTMEPWPADNQFVQTVKEVSNL